MTQHEGEALLAALIGAGFANARGSVALRLLRSSDKPKREEIRAIFEGAFAALAGYMSPDNPFRLKLDATVKSEIENLIGEA